jgi:hypothetical protein
LERTLSVVLLARTHPTGISFATKALFAYFSDKKKYLPSEINIKIDGKLRSKINGPNKSRGSSPSKTLQKGTAKGKGREVHHFNRLIHE